MSSEQPVLPLPVVDFELQTRSALDRNHADIAYFVLVDDLEDSEDE